ncbi:MAG: glycosyl hydrolase family 95 catalytic domain-containing protein, partial [Lentisphaeria bacterium]
YEDAIIHDQQLIWDLFDNTITAATILKVDKEWSEQLKNKRDRLLGNKISKEGYLQEWLIDRPNMVKEHRHTSHLYAVYPSEQINMHKTPELAKAAMKSLELRGTSGDSRRSWTWPWRTALWARFYQGEKAHEMIQGYLKYNLMDNLLATHTPFQMDGTYGMTAGICEMLLQSHAGRLHLLPALPKVWKTGSVQGIRGRGNFIVDINWENEKIVSGKILSQNGGLCRVYGISTNITDSKGKKVKSKKLSDNSVEFMTKAGEFYKIN